MTWQDDLLEKSEKLNAVQISIDGSVYTMTSSKDGVRMVDPYQNENQFPDMQSIISHWESNLENPTIVVL